MNNFRDWYVRNQDAITWFLIGWLTFAGIEDLLNERYGWAAFNLVFAYINYKMRDFRMQ